MNLFVGVECFHFINYVYVYNFLRVCVLGLFECVLCLKLEIDIFAYVR